DNVSLNSAHFIVLGCYSHGGCGCGG
ncbi:hypothetical protein A2U01_0079800, partial [Trifolium medium]|nr:hypothetical protein [Trifolium medium]